MFDTLLVEDGRPVALERHLARLAASVDELYGGTLPPSLAVGAAAAAASAVTPGGRARLRIDADRDGRVTITVSPARARPERPLLLEPFALPGGLGDHKWRDRRLLDALTALRPGAVPLLVDTDGLVLEAGYANVWIVEGDALITPPADGRILPGVTRELLLVHAPEIGLIAIAEPISLDRARQADAIFLTSSLRLAASAALEGSAANPGSGATIGAIRTVLQAVGWEQPPAPR